MNWRRKYPEEKFHIQVAKFLNLALPTDSFWTTTPTVASSITMGARLKAKGYVRGTPDLQIVYQGRSFWIELKSAEGRVSADQRIVATLLTRAGAKVGLAYDLNDVQQWLDEWCIPLSARIDPRSITGARVIA